MYKIYDDCISSKLITDIEKTLTFYYFCWHYLPNTVTVRTSKEDSPQMSHVFYAMLDNKEEFSNKFNIIKDLLSEVNINTDLDIENLNLWRAKANLIFPCADKQMKSSLPHVDFPEKNTTLLYYVNQSDGDTVFFDKDKKTIVERVTPKRGRFIVFDSSKWHASCNPIKSMKRIVININMGD